MQQFQLTATYTGEVEYEVYVRAIDTADGSSVSIAGASSFTATQVTVGTTPQVLIPASLTERIGLVLKNWGGAGNLYVAQSLVAATPATGFGLGPKDALAMDLAAGVALYASTDSGTVDVRIAQAGS